MQIVSKTCKSADELADRVAELFSARGYKLEEGTKFQGVYGNGSVAMRVLLGGLAKRNKFSITVLQNAESGFAVDVDKAMSGAMGGVIGVTKMDNEFTRIQEMLANL